MAGAVAASQTYAMLKRHCTVLLSCLLAASASAAGARPLATTSLVSCSAGDCLLVRGRRASSGATVRINGRLVESEGGKAWRVELPVATVRDWSAPFARTLDVSVTSSAGTIERRDTVRLPTGMFSRKSELASLIVRAR